MLCCRAFSGWPGSWAKLSYSVEGSSTPELLEVKIITTSVGGGNGGLGLGGGSSSSSSGSSSNSNCDNAIALKKGSSCYTLDVVCANGSVLSILELQPKHKKVMTVKAFANGFRGDWSTLEYVQG